MNKFIILNYLNRIRPEDIINFANSQGIYLSNNDIDIIYKYIRNNPYKIINNPEGVLNDAKNLVSNETYNKLVELYYKYKDKIDLL